MQELQKDSEFRAFVVALELARATVPEGTEASAALRVILNDPRRTLAVFCGVDVSGTSHTKDNSFIIELAPIDPCGAALALACVNSSFKATFDFLQKCALTWTAQMAPLPKIALLNRTWRALAGNKLLTGGHAQAHGAGLPKAMTSFKRASNSNRVVFPGVRHAQLREYISQLGEFVRLQGTQQKSVLQLEAVRQWSPDQIRLAYFDGNGDLFTAPLEHDLSNGPSVLELRSVDWLAMARKAGSRHGGQAFQSLFRRLAAAPNAANEAYNNVLVHKPTRTIVAIGPGVASIRKDPAQPGGGRIRAREHFYRRNSDWATQLMSCGAPLLDEIVRFGSVDISEASNYINVTAIMSYVKERMGNDYPQFCDQLFRRYLTDKDYVVYSFVLRADDMGCSTGMFAELLLMSISATFTSAVRTDLKFEMTPYDILMAMSLADERLVQFVEAAQPLSLANSALALRDLLQQSTVRALGEALAAELQVEHDSGFHSAVRNNLWGYFRARGANLYFSMFLTSATATFRGDTAMGAALALMMMRKGHTPETLATTEAQRALLRQSAVLERLCRGQEAVGLGDIGGGAELVSGQSFSMTYGSSYATAPPNPTYTPPPPPEVPEPPGFQAGRRLDVRYWEQVKPPAPRTAVGKLLCNANCDDLEEELRWRNIEVPLVAAGGRSFGSPAAAQLRALLLSRLPTAHPEKVCYHGVAQSFDAATGVMKVQLEGYKNPTRIHVVQDEWCWSADSPATSSSTAYGKQPKRKLQPIDEPMGTTGPPGPSAARVKSLGQVQAAKTTALAKAAAPSRSSQRTRGAQPDP